MFNKINILMIILSVIAFCINCFGQEKSKLEIVEANRTKNCEYVSAIYDGFIQETPINKNIIVISYKGKSETIDKIAERRLYNAKIHITEYYKNTSYSRSEEKVITALSIDESDVGKLAFFVDGNLRLLLFFWNNRDFNLSPCHVESKDFCEDKIKQMYYPCYKNVNLFNMNMRWSNKKTGHKTPC